MASIQILEIPPVEAQIEDLSDDITSSIHGGNIFEEIGRFVDELIRFVGGETDKTIQCTRHFLQGRLSLGQFIDCILA